MRKKNYGGRLLQGDESGSLMTKFSAILAFDFKAQFKGRTNELTQPSGPIMSRTITSAFRQVALPSR